MNEEIRLLNSKVKEASEVLNKVLEQLSKVIVGQKYMIERLLIGLLADGHILLEGVPGLAKTLTISSLANTIKADFKRVQFTPDLLPADIIGTLIFNQKNGEFIPKKGPIFANIILADEINRAPAKVQSALLEAMQEKHITIGDTTYHLPRPFLVLATQNPIEQEGTYPLPEAQVDRFMMKIKITYPTKTEERIIIDRMTGAEVPEVGEVINTDEILKLRKMVKEIYVDDNIKDYILNIIFATRKPEEFGLEDYRDLIEYGASPRASIYLLEAARANAFLRHRGYVTPDDIKSVANDILRHRVIVTYEAEAENITSEDIVNKIIETIEVP